MKKTTKILSVVMAVIVVILSCSIIAFAEDEHSHNYTATTVMPTCAERGYTLYVCGECGDYYKDNYTDAFGHSWGAWTTVDEASCAAEGHNQRTCSVCSSVETKTIPVLEHVDSNSNGKCDLCGADVSIDKEYILNPYDWLKALFQFILNWFRGIFA